MAMTAGSASADQASGAITGSGMALVIAQQLYLVFTAGFTSAQLNYQNPNASPANAYVFKVGAANQACAWANALASALVPYIQANATAHVTTQSLGWTPEPNNAGTAILGPVNNTIPAIAPVDIPIT